MGEKSLSRRQSRHIVLSLGRIQFRHSKGNKTVKVNTRLIFFFLVEIFIHLSSVCVCATDRNLLRSIETNTKAADVE